MSGKKYGSFPLCRLPLISPIVPLYRLLPMVRLVGILLNRLFRFGCLFCEPFSVKSGIEPVYLRRSNYTSTFVHIRALNFVKRNKTTRKSVRKSKIIKELFPIYGNSWKQILSKIKQQILLLSCKYIIDMKSNID